MSASTQPMQALAYANTIRIGRARILQPLRMGQLVIGDVDLDAPELQSMTVMKFLQCLRYRRGGSPGKFKPPARTKAREVLRSLQIGETVTIGQLTEARKLQLVERVEERVLAQRRDA